ncbi:MAG: hypothetical protein AB7S65_12535 [Sulfuricurvum sp.]
MTPSNKAESIAILDEYRDRLTPEQYRNIERAIGHLAIEGMFADRVEIDRAVRAETGKITHEEALAEILGR